MRAGRVVVEVGCCEHRDPASRQPLAFDVVTATRGEEPLERLDVSSHLLLGALLIVLLALTRFLAKRVEGASGGVGARRPSWSTAGAVHLRADRRG